MRNIVLFLAILFFIGEASAQAICNSQGNLIIYSNYDGGILTIDVDVNIPNLRIGISSYEPIQVILTGSYVSNVARVEYAGLNSTQNNNNCNQGNFQTSITGISPDKVGIKTTPAIGYASPNGSNLMIGANGQCSATLNAGGANTSDQIVSYFQQVIGGALYAHFTRYNCFLNETLRISDGGNCCVAPFSGTSSSFSSQYVSACTGKCLQFLNTSTGGPFTAVTWLFPGGTPSSSTEYDPFVCYSQTGFYYVTLQVTTANSSAFLTTFISVTETGAAQQLSPPAIEYVR